ncbi:MAG: PLP-dependent aminotransferase family protein, partial [Saprospiraceae bacterium]|nr:PLP-dependent aminotransferase family protein [Saprospiraceae bacterium]
FCETGRYDLHLRHLRKALHTQCLRYSQAIAAFFPEGTRISRPQGGYVLWIELPRKVNALDVYRRARRQQIAIAPGQLFSLSEQFAHYIRIGFGAPFTDTIELGLKRLGSLVV